MSPGPRTNRSQEFQELVAMLRARAGSRPVGAPELSVEEYRASYEELAAAFSDPPPVLRAPADADGVPAEWASTKPLEDTPSAVLLLHGGGYTIGSIATYRDLSARIATATGAAVLTIAYRLAPEHLFPAAVDDAVTSYRWLLKQVVDPGRIVVVGDSAGGGLTMAMLVALRDEGDTLPAGAAVISPRVDLVQTGSSVDTQAALDPMVTPAVSLANGIRYVGPDGDLAHPLASPIYADLRGLPPIYVQVGTAEILLDDALRLASRLRAAGVELDLDVLSEGIHVLPIFASRVPEAAAALRNVTDYLSQRLRS